MMSELAQAPQAEGEALASVRTWIASWSMSTFDFNDVLCNFSDFSISLLEGEGCLADLIRAKSRMTVGQGIKSDAES
jgi:hypothetical protein